jgi:hypothetical protein
MFIGHFGAAYAAKKIRNAPSLGTLILASQFIDLLWPVFLILGIEKVRIDPGNTAFTPLDFLYYPFSHSLAGVLVWAALFAVVYFIVKRNIANSLLLAGLVASHWVLDLVTHRPDLPLSVAGTMKFGFGMWNSVALTLVVELLIFSVGMYLYLKATQPINRKGFFAFWGLQLFLAVMYLVNVFGPPPPSETAIGYAGLGMWLFVAWGYWIDRNRKQY